MGFRCGIVGLPNVGKSTLFNALTRSSVPAENYPFCTTDRHVGVVPVPDPRLAKISERAPKPKVTPTVMEFVDIAGLVKGASTGEGLGNQFLSHIAEVEVIAHLVRCFEEPGVIHVSGTIDPARDIEVVKTELGLKDLATLTAAIQRLEKVAKSGDKKAAAAIGSPAGTPFGRGTTNPSWRAAASLETLKKVEKPLNEGKDARDVIDALDPQEQEVVKPLHLLTAKAILYVANVDEKQLAAGEKSPQLRAIQEIAGREGAPVVPICARLEAQIATLETQEERLEYLRAVGLEEPGLYRLIQAGYRALHLVTFFTIVSDENRAWTVRQGSSALKAAGTIHTDMARGFIRAEVMGFDDFVSCGSEEAARKQGKLRLEGKEYIVQDGDLMHFRFSV